MKIKKARFGRLDPSAFVQLGFSDVGDGSGGGGTAGAPAEPAEGSSGASGEPPTTDQPDPKAPAGPEKVEDLPEWAQKIVKDARDGEAKSRTNAKAEAAKAAKAELAQEIGKMLGLVKDDATQIDPAQLAQQAAAAQRETALELALYKSSQGVADPEKLLDSRAFMSSVKDLDPTDSEAIKKAITEAVTKNPAFQAQAAGASAVQHPGGSGARTERGFLSLDEAAAQHYGTS